MPDRRSAFRALREIGAVLLVLATVVALGLVLTIFFATSFTTALQRVYLRAWRRPPGNTTGEYVRGPVWFLAGRHRQDEERRL